MEEIIKEHIIVQVVLNILIVVDHTGNLLDRVLTNHILIHYGLLMNKSQVLRLIELLLLLSLLLSQLIGCR